MSETDRKLAGELGRSSGLKFEDQIKKHYAGRKPKNMPNYWGEKKAVSKTDVICKNKRLSVKNPAKMSSSIQIQICSLENFARRLEMPKEVKKAFEMWLGAHENLLSKETFRSQDTFKEVYKNWGPGISCDADEAMCDHEFVDCGPQETQTIPFSYLCPCCELNRARLLFSRVPNNHLMLSFIKDNMKEILKIILSTGFNHPSNKDTIAKYMAWATEKNSLDSIVLLKISQIIKHHKNWEVKVRQAESVIEFGPFTLQMKGSGSGAAYHYMQFNTSYNDIIKFTGLKGGKL